MKKIGIAVGGVALLGFLEMMRELHSFRVRRYETSLPDQWKGTSPIRIVFLADLHGKEYGTDNEKLIEAVRGEEPDLILTGGDMLIRSQVETAKHAIHLLKVLSGIAPVYCANGNHEQQMREKPDKYHDLYEQYKEQLKGYVHFLENDSEEVEIKGVPFTITGLEVPMSCYSHFGTKPLSTKEISKLIEAPNKDRFQILLAHNPVYMKQYQQWGSNMTLSGHLHGGIVRIPGIGGIITPQVEFFPKYSGDMYCEGEHCGIVSRGLGTHTVNVRLFNEAELVSVVLK